MKRSGFLRTAGSIVAIGVAGAAIGSPGRYLELDEFLKSVGVAQESPEVVFIDRDLRLNLEAVFGHRLSLLRVRFWRDQDTTAWVLDEIGKTEPITLGVAVEDGRVQSVRVLEFRESRGSEIRLPFFTNQFTGAGLVQGQYLDRHVDGITGATLSVAAVDKVVRAALILDQRVRSR